MANVRQIDFMLLDSLFEMHSGYVLDFSNKTFAAFFAEELNIDIDHPAYHDRGTSKANRLRCFLQKTDPASAVRTLRALWDYREAMLAAHGREEPVSNAEGRLLELINRIKGRPAQAPAAEKLLELRGQYGALMMLQPQERGYAFERFLKELFTFYGMEARSAFRLQGEQIDGSFVLGSEIYLIGRNGRTSRQTLETSTLSMARWNRKLPGHADCSSATAALARKAYMRSVAQSA